MPPFHPLSKPTSILPRKAKGNISLLVILVLLASSLFSLLAMAQLKNLMTHGNLTYNYFRAHYLSKAGLELALTETYTRGAGFEMTGSSLITTGSSIVASNLLSWYENRDPYFAVQMKAKSSLIGNSVKVPTCSSDKNQKILKKWDSIVIPLFYDKGADSHQKILSENNQYQHLPLSDIQKISLTALNPNNAELVFWLFAFADEKLMDMVDMMTKTGTSLNNFLRSNEDAKYILEQSAFKYLTIVNPKDEEITLCVSAEGVNLPVADTLINVQAHYWNTEVGLQAIFSEPFPNFLQVTTQLEN